MRMTTSEERFRTRYRQDEKGCWIWTGAVGGSRDPRPQIRVNWKCYYAARYSWELHRGPIPKGLLVCHTCDESLCVNPEHLFLGTQKENMRDASRKGRLNGKKAINEKIVTAVQQLRRQGKTQREISQQLSLPISTVGHLCIGTRWGPLG